MSLRAGYYGVKRFLRDKLETIARTYDTTIKSLFLRSEQAVLGAKNFLNITAASTTFNGVTFTVNPDKTITVTTEEGGATATTYLNLCGNFKVAKGSYILNGCPSGGSWVDPNKYAIKFRKSELGGLDVNEVGDGLNIDITDSMANDNYVAFICVGNGQVLNNVTFKPMLRMASDPDDTYAPHAMTNRELTNSAAEQKTAINAIITAATGAADFAAFKTAMGAITPVTRSLSLTREDITEEVKEAEPEKTVTKKRTTKKTEEV